MTPREAAWKKDFEAEYAESEIDLSFRCGALGLIWMKAETDKLWREYCNYRTFLMCTKPIKAVSI